MPAYSYRCPECGWEGTRYAVPIDDRDQQRCGDDCAAMLAREEISESNLGKDAYGFAPGMRAGSDGRMIANRKRKPATVRRA